MINITEMSCSLFLLSVMICTCLSQESKDVKRITDCKPMTKIGGINVLNCSGIAIEELPDDIPDKAEVLDFSGNAFTKFPYIAESAKCHYSCGVSNTSNLCRLSITFRGNNIESFDEFALHNLKCLQTLDLSYNDIRGQVFHPAFFQEGAYYLERLILRDNPLGELPDNVITHPFLPNLKYLDISYCRLSKLGKNSIDDLTHLQVLDLSHNQLADIHRETFKGLIRLKTLDLSGNLLTYFPQQVFGDLRSLNELRLTGNKLQGFHADAFSDDSPLMVLDLSNNFFSSVPYKALEKLHSLYTLNLSINPIQHLNTGNTGDSSTTVQSLILDNINVLESIDPDEFKAFPNLRTVSISGCRSLTKFNLGREGSSYRLLQDFRLENNWLTTLTSDALPWHQLQQLHLGGNPWMCDAQLKWMLEADNIHGPVICAAPAHLRGKDLKTLEADDLKGNVSIAPLVGLIVIIVSIPVICAISVFIYKRRRFCCCNTHSLQGRYVSVFTHGDDDKVEDRVAFELKQNSDRIKTVSNGGADDTKHLVQLDNNGHLTATVVDEEEEI